MIVGHIAFDTEDVAACKTILDNMKPPIKYQLNVSVPTGDAKTIV